MRLIGGDGHQLGVNATSSFTHKRSEIVIDTILNMTSCGGKRRLRCIIKYSLSLSIYIFKYSVSILPT